LAKKKKWQEGSNDNWANDSVFQAKSGGQVFMKDPNKSWMDYYREDQAKKKQEQAKGQVRFREASTASRIQYTNPTYTGNSKNANYKWETQALKDVKMPKHSSRTYNSKFDYLTKQMGLSSAQADDFRKYMDFGEDQSKTKYEKNIYDNKTDSKGKLITYDKSGNEDPNGIYLKTAHTSSPAGSSLNMKSTIIDGILNGMTSRAVQGVKDSNKANAKKEQQVQAQKQTKSQQPSKHSGGNAFLNTVDSINSGLTSAYDHTLGPVQDLVNRFLTNANDQVALGQFKKNVNAKNAPKFVQDAVKAPTSTAQKVADVSGQLAGAAVPLGLAYKPAGLAAKALTASKYGQAAIRGGLASGIYSGATQGLDETIHPNDANLKQRLANVGINTALGAALDPALLGVGAGVSNLMARNAKVAGELPTYSGNVSDSVLNSLVPNQPKSVTGSQALYDQLLGVNKPQPTKTIGDVNIGEIPKATVPNVLDDLLNFAQSGQGPTARGLVGKVANPARYAKENVSNQADTILNRVDAINKKPQGYYEQRILDVQKAMQSNHGLTADQQKSLEEAQKAIEQYKVYEDAHVQKELTPFTEAAQKQADAQAQHQNIVKAAKDELARIKGTYGKIKATAGEAQDYQIPNQFRAGVNNMAHDDIHQFATQEGFSSVDEAVQYLKHLDETSKLKLKDVMPQDSHVLSADDWAHLEHAARKNFAGTPEGQTLDKFIADLVHAGQSDGKNFNELYAANKGPNDPQSFDELVKLAQMQSAPTDLKTSLRQDPRIKQALDQLDALGGKKPDILPGIPQAQPDTSSIDEMIKFLSQNENVNKSQDVSKVIDQLVSPKSQSKKLTMDELNQLVRGEKPPKPEPNVTSGDKKGLLGVNLQQFNNDIPSIIKDSKPIESVSATDAIKNPVKKVINKFYEGYVNKTHSAKVAHTSILENEIRKLTESGAKPRKLEQLKGQLKFVKKYGSDVEKAIQNESAAGMRAKTFLDGHMENLQSALGSTKPEDMANAIRYQVAKNIKWIWDKVNPDYEIGGGWTKGEINTILNEGVGNSKLENFTKAMKNLTQQRLDFALKYNLINKEAHAALSKNPYYIPMARDVTPGMDNVARGLKGGNTSNKRTAGAYFIQSLGDGDAEALYKDPLETLMSGTFSLFKNMAKSDSEQQLLKMAKMDSDNLFSRVVNKKEFESNGGIAVPTPKGTQYIQLQDDLMKMIKENDLPYDLNVIGKMTSVFAGAKTRSLEYHMTGVPRDLAEGYLKGQTNNPFTYLKEIVKAAKEHNLSAKDAGAYFDKAYKDGMNGINSEKMMKEYARQNKNVKPFNPKSKESWKDLTHTIARIADMPFKPIKAIGQLSDELPRTVEIKATQKAFMKQHGKQINNIKKALEDVNAQIDGASHATDPFDPALQGVDKLKSQKTKLEGMLSKYDKALQRETTYRGRDIMNFSRSGRSGAAKHIRQYMIFANTATQSKDKLIRSFIERPAATIAKTALLTAPLVAAEQVMQQNLSGKDKEIYDNLPSWSKQYNYVFINNGSVYTLPKIQELALLTDPIEALLSGNKEDLNAAARLGVKEAVPYQLGNVAQGLVPNTDGSVTVRKNMQVPSLIASPALDVAANDKLGFNRNAISFADKFGRKNPQANKFTLDLFKKIGGNKARADYLQYLATTYPGDAGKYGSYSLDYLLDPKNNDKLDAMLQNLNPLQDRVFSTNATVAGHKIFKNPPKKSAVTKK
jgi:hypothetical protein